MKINNAINLILLTAFTFLITCCEKTSVFDSSIIAMEKMQLPEEFSTPQPIGELEIIEENGLICKCQTFVWNPGYTEALLFNNSASSIYPGILLLGQSILNGGYAPASGDRAPMTLSISLANLANSASVEDVDPSLSNVRNALLELLSQQVAGATNAEISFDLIEVHSEEHLQTAIGANFNAPFAQISSSFDFNSSEQKSRFLIRFNQTYYTVDMDTPNDPSDLFLATPDLNSFDGTSPVYVSSVKYGRMAFFMMESSVSSSELEAAINASFNAFIGSTGSLDGFHQHEAVFDATSIKALIVGGSASDAVQSITGIQGIIDYIIQGGEYSANSPGAPLAFTMRYLSDNSIAKIVLASEYKVRNCEPLPSETMTFQPNPIENICPDHIGGDREFDGNGPMQEASAQLIYDEDEIRVRVMFHLKETTPDWSEALYQEDFLIWTAPSDYEIVSIVSDTQTSVSAEDDDTSLDVFSQPIDELVSKFEIMGDTGGLDIGDCTEDDSFLSVFFNQVVVEVRPL
ncbi:MAG: thiol-activated cytolysin family protein [Bacteroidota bacterium]